MERAVRCRCGAVRRAVPTTAAKSTSRGGRRVRPRVARSAAPKDPWWRDPETGRLNGVARRSLVAAAAQLAFAGVALAAQRALSEWRARGLEARWRRGGGGTFAEAWVDEQRAWREPGRGRGGDDGDGDDAGGR
jgi:hypothetical protein